VKLLGTLDVSPRHKSIGHRSVSAPLLASTAARRFALRFLAAWVVLLALLEFLPIVQVWSIRATLRSMAMFYSILGLDTGIHGAVLSIKGASVRIVSDCTPIKPIAVLFSAILAFPSGWLWKAVGLGFGGIALWIFNVLRVAAGLLVLKLRPSLFDLADAYLWQAIALVAVVALFLAWTSPMRSRRADL